jgi:hypothetical protein
MITETTTWKGTAYLQAKTLERRADEILNEKIKDYWTSSFEDKNVISLDVLLEAGFQPIQGEH